MRDPGVDRRRILISGFALLLTVLGVLVGEKVTDRYLFAWDKGLVPCLPYRTFIIDRKDMDVSRGDLVSFRTFGLSASIRPDSIFTKLVVGVPGDEIRINEDGVFVNDAMIGPIFEDVAKNLKRPMDSFHAEYRLGDGEFFLAGTEDSSFDSRFYGPVPASQFVGQSYGVW